MESTLGEDGSMEGLALILVGLTDGDDPPNIAAIRITDGEFDATHHTDRDPAGFSVVEAIIAAFEDRTREDLATELEIDPVPAKIAIR